MPAEFICNSCKLGIIIGWYHYHDFEDHWAATYLVCSSCGTLHRMEHPRDPEQTPSRIQHFGGPLHGLEQNEYGRLLSPEPSELSEMATHESAELECAHCHATGTLTKDLDKGSPCPSCGVALDKCISLWMT